MVNTGSNVYTLVISQYEKNNTIHYTLRVYATSEFKLTRVANPYNPRYEKQVGSFKLLYVLTNYNLTFGFSYLSYFNQTSSVFNVIVASVDGNRRILCYILLVIC